MITTNEDLRLQELERQFKAVYIRLSALESKIGTLADPETPNYQSNTNDEEIGSKDGGLSEREKWVAEAMFNLLTPLGEDFSCNEIDFNYFMQNAPPPLIRYISDPVEAVPKLVSQVAEQQAKIKTLLAEIERRGGVYGILKTVF